MFYARLPLRMVRYPDIRVASRSGNPLVVVAAVRQAMRRAGADRAEIRRFSNEAFASDDPLGMLEVCRKWVGSAESATDEAP